MATAGRDARQIQGERKANARRRQRQKHGNGRAKARQTHGKSNIDAVEKQGVRICICVFWGGAGPMQILTLYLKRSDVRTSDYVFVYLGVGPGPMQFLTPYFKRSDVRTSEICICVFGGVFRGR